MLTQEHAPQIGSVVFPNESGDITMMRNRSDQMVDQLSWVDTYMPKHTGNIPPAANDNVSMHPNIPRVVGLMGYGGSGKSEVARYLRGVHGFTALHVKAPLRAMAAALLAEAQYSPAEIHDYLDGKLKRDVIPALRTTGTEVQQFLGTEFGRDFCYPDLWLDLWLRKSTAVLDTGGRVVQESVRFENEADAIRNLGGVIVRVERPGVGPLSDHPSEVPPAEPDFVIHNNGTLGDLRMQVATWLRHAS